MILIRKKSLTSMFAQVKYELQLMLIVKPEKIVGVTRFIDLKNYKRVIDLIDLIKYVSGTHQLSRIVQFQHISNPLTQNHILNYDPCPNAFIALVLCSVIEEPDACLNDFSVILLCGVIVEPCFTLSYVRTPSMF